MAALAIRNSYNCGVVGHHVERLAREGLVALAFGNTPAAIAPWGGHKPFFGTNPIAFAAPCAEASPVVIDQSASVVARGEVMLHASQGRPIPEGWALDAQGQPTTDPRAALAGSMLPAGGYKGAAIALMVEVLAATLVGTTLSCAATSFADSKGGPPRTGQLFIALDPRAFGDGSFERSAASGVAIYQAPCDPDAGASARGSVRSSSRWHRLHRGIPLVRSARDRRARAQDQADPRALGDASSWSASRTKATRPR